MNSDYIGKLDKLCEEVLDPSPTLIKEYMDQIDWVNFSKYPKTDKILREYKNRVIWWEVAAWIRLTPGNIKEFFPYLPRLLPENVEKIPRSTLLCLDLSGVELRAKDIFGEFTDVELSTHPEFYWKYPEIIDVNLIPEETIHHNPKILSLFLESSRKVSLGTLSNLAYLNNIHPDDIPIILEKYGTYDGVIIAIWKSLSWSQLSRAISHSFIAELLDTHPKLISQGRVVKEMLKSFGGVSVVDKMTNHRHLVYDICDQAGWDRLSRSHEFTEDDLIKYYDNINWIELFKFNKKSMIYGIGTYLSKNPKKTFGEGALKNMEIGEFAKYLLL